MPPKSSFAGLVAKFAGAAALVATCFAAGAADPFPSKEIRFIVPWNAGGSNDISARALAQLAAEEGVKVVVENVPGATGAIGLTKVANAEPDGYTIGMGTSSTLAQIAQGLTPLRNERFAPAAKFWNESPNSARGSSGNTAARSRRGSRFTAANPS